MSTFSVLVLTAAPATQGPEAGGAYVKIDGREALLRSVELFLNRDNVKQIQLVVSPDSLEEAKQKFGAHLGFSGVKLVAGGPRWMDQLKAGGKSIAEDCTHVIIHDAARPIVPFSDIDNLMEQAGSHAFATLAIPMRSQLVELDEGSNPVAFHLPTQFMQVLTPQAFTKSRFQQLATTGKEVHASEAHLVKASPLNIRVGGSGEERIAKAMLGMLPKPKSKAPLSPFEEAQW